jgi:hypothetical protein
VWRLTCELLALSGCPGAHELEHVLGRGVGSLPPSTVVGTGREHTTLVSRTRHRALDRRTDCGHKSLSLAVAPHDDPVGAAPEQKCAATTRATGKVLQTLEAKHDMAPTA